MNISFVILHYENVEDTKNCINSILNLENKNVNYFIYIIDNASSNGSGVLLEKLYKKNKNIKVIKLSKNFGFSKANNIGYLLAKSSNKSDIIVVLNNDILIQDKEWFYKIKKIYDLEKDHTAIIAPDIINFDGNHQNPLRKDAMTLRSSYKNLFYNNLLLLFLYIPILNKCVYKLDQNRSEKWFKNYYNLQKVEIMENIVPHGAAVIYFPLWIKNEKVAFPSDTFMYLEEDFLKRYCDNKNYLIKYIPELKVKHLEGRSVSSVNHRNQFLSYRFKLSRVTSALKTYICDLLERR